MGCILEEGLLPLRLLFDVTAEAEAQQAHDGGNCQQHPKERPVQRHDIAGDGPDIYVHDIGIRFFRIAVVLLHGHEDQVVLVCLEVVTSIGRNRPFTAIRQQLFLQPIGVLAPCVGLVAVLQLKKHNAGREEMLLRPVVPIVIIHLALIGVRNGAILILRLVAQRLFRLAYKVGGDHYVHRQHEKGKEQQCRTEDQIHDPQLDVLHVRSASFSLYPKPHMVLTLTVLPACSSFFRIRRSVSSVTRVSTSESKPHTALSNSSRE